MRDKEKGTTRSFEGRRRERDERLSEIVKRKEGEES